MDQLPTIARQWLAGILARDFETNKHIHAHQDEVFKITTSGGNYYLKLATALAAERDNLQKLAPWLRAPQVIDFYESADQDYLLISELPGKNLVELIGEWPEPAIVETFAAAVKQLHRLNARAIFPEAKPNDVLLHGDMALPNIIISDDQQIGYIDFGQLAFGTPELDLTDAIWSLQRNLGPAYGALFLEQYGPVQMTPKIEEALAFRYQPPAPGQHQA